MTVGIRTFDQSGNIIMDHDTRMGRVLGSVVTNSVAGSVTDSGFNTGEAYWIVIPIVTDLSTGIRGGSRLVSSFSGTTLSWTYEAGTPTNCIIVYGVR